MSEWLSDAEEAMKRDLDRASFRFKRLYEDMCMIRRSTDDMPELKDINRMARESILRAAKEMSDE